jgi:transposase
VEFRERAVRMVTEVRPEYGSQWAAIRAVAGRLGIGAPATVRTWVRRAEVDADDRPGVTSEQAAELAGLKRENAELRRANETAIAFITEHKDRSVPLVDGEVAGRR